MQPHAAPSPATHPALSRHDAAAVGFPLGVPTFPGTDHLTPDTFKVVVASWRRLNPSTTPTSDFAVDVTTYAPKLPFVKRVQLVDAQVPNTQRLIEDVWNRLYYGQGFVTTPCLRSLTLEVHGPPVLPRRVVASVVLPLPVDAVLSATPVPGRPGVTRIVTKHAAPRPIAAVAEAWASLVGAPGCFVLAGVPGLSTPGALGFSLLPSDVTDVEDAGAGPNAFDVLSYALADAVAALDPGRAPCMALVAAPLGSDVALAAALTRCGRAALGALCLQAPVVPPGCAALGGAAERSGGPAAPPCTTSALDPAATSGLSVTLSNPWGGTTVVPPAPTMSAAQAAGLALASAPPLPLAGPWRFAVSYCSGPQEDRFKVEFTGPRHLPSGRHVLSLRVAPGALASYLGLDGVPLVSGAPPVPAACSRGQSPQGYARIPSTNYPTPNDLAAAVAAAASTYTWPPYTVTVTVPVPGGSGSTTTVVPMDGGHATLQDMADALEAALDTALPALDVQVRVEEGAGLVFTSVATPSPYAFSLTMPTGAVVAPRLGYAPGVTTPFATQHRPTGDAVHVPLWADCEVAPMGDVAASVTPAGELVLTSVPFAPFQALVAATGACPGSTAAWTLTQPVGSTFLPGLQAGAIVALVSAAGPPYPQVLCVVTGVRVAPSNAVEVVQLDATVPFTAATSPATCTVVPQHPPPLQLYMQTASALVSRPFPVPAVVFGFQPDTYVSTLQGVLQSPGTIRTRCDPFVLLCLSFNATDLTALTGDVYYPLEVPSGGTQLVFAQVLRCSADFRSDYDRVFTHSFPGAGIHLGYIRVRLLNADGTPYITHGHPVTVCLRMEVVGDGISMGGPAHMTLLPDCSTSAQQQHAQQLQLQQLQAQMSAQASGGGASAPAVRMGPGGLWQ